MKKLSILICSLNRRKAYLERLQSILKPQVTNNVFDVEVLCNIDDGTISIGEKRQHLLESATGEYIAYIDDDDIVTDDYINLILQATKDNPDVMGMHLIMKQVSGVETEGVITGDTIHSLKYNTWYDEPIPGNPHCRYYYRNPNHLNPVKRVLALKAGFPPISMCEDRQYSAKLLPHLKTEYMIYKPIYYYLVRNFKEA